MDDGWGIGAYSRLAKYVQPERYKYRILLKLGASARAHRAVVRVLLRLGAQSVSRSCAA